MAGNSRFKLLIFDFFLYFLNIYLIIVDFGFESFDLLFKVIPLPIRKQQRLIRPPVFVNLDALARIDLHQRVVGDGF